MSYIRFSSHEACQVAVSPACLYRLVYGKAYPDKLTEEEELRLNFHIEERLLRYHTRPIIIYRQWCMKIP